MFGLKKHLDLRVREAIFKPVLTKILNRFSEDLIQVHRSSLITEKQTEIHIITGTDKKVFACPPGKEKKLVQEINEFYFKNN